MFNEVIYTKFLVHFQLSVGAGLIVVTGICSISQQKSKKIPFLLGWSPSWGRGAKSLGVKGAVIGGCRVTSAG